MGAGKLQPGGNLGLIQLLEIIQPSAFKEKIPLPLARHPEWHPTPSFLHNQEKTSVMLFLTSIVTFHVNIHTSLRRVKSFLSSSAV
jgi:hypothetical protein